MLSEMAGHAVRIVESDDTNLKVTTPLDLTVAGLLALVFASLLLIGAGAITVQVLAAFESTLAEVVALAFFVPAIVYMADAVGTQTEAVVIRGMAVGVSIGMLVAHRRMPAGDWGKRLAMGLVIGGALANTMDRLVHGAVADFFLSNGQVFYGESSNYELVVKQQKLGGNGPIMANALASFGMNVTYIGNLGYPAIHPVFEEFAKRAEERLGRFFGE